jgi:hypothetical protein
MFRNEAVAATGMSINTVPSSSRLVHFYFSVYHPHAWRVVEERSVVHSDPSMEQTERKGKESERDLGKDRENVWNSKAKPPKRMEGGYMEWVMDMERNKVPEEGTEER